MSGEKNKAMWRHMIGEVNKRNYEVVWEPIAPDCIIHNDNPPPSTFSKDEFKGLMDEVTRAFPDYHLEIEDMIAEGDKVVALFTESGTMKGPMMGMEPTGKSYTMPAMEIYRFANGKVTEIWMVRNLASMYQQLGLSG